LGSPSAFNGGAKLARPEAGGSRASCDYSSLERSDYTLPFTDAEWATRQATFPDGVCDFTKPAVDQGPTVPWLTYGRSGGRVIYGGRRLGPPRARRVLRGGF
jgi:hypothetical protein